MFDQIQNFGRLNHATNRANDIHHFVLKPLIWLALPDESRNDLEIFKISFRIRVFDAKLQQVEQLLLALHSLRIAAHAINVLQNQIRESFAPEVLEKQTKCHECLIADRFVRICKLVDSAGYKSAQIGPLSNAGHFQKFVDDSEDGDDDVRPVRVGLFEERKEKGKEVLFM